MPSHARKLLLLSLATAFLATACSGNNDDTNHDQPDATLEDTGDADSDSDSDSDSGEELDLPDHRTADCDPLMPDYCSMPWPSNLYLQEDDQRATGYTIDFGPTTLPESTRDGHIQPDAFRSLDGYGWGTPVVVLFPDIDTSGMPTEDAIEDSVEDDERQAFYFKVTDQGLEPVPFWAELDSWAQEGDDQVLFLRPAVILEENTRYIVGFRNLVDTSGNAIARSDAFEKYLSGEAAEDEELAWRQQRFNQIFDLLEDANISRNELTLAWDFHSGSSDGLHSTLLHVIEEGLAAAEAEGIDLNFTVTPRAGDENIALEIEGTFRVPHFLEESTRTPAPVAFRFHRDEAGDPAIAQWRDARFWMAIPHGALNGEPHGLVTYGHGMLGRGSQAQSSYNRPVAANHQLIYFGADFIGFSESDIPQAGWALQQPTYFEELIDRMHQGVLEYVLLGKVIREDFEDHPDLGDYEVSIDYDRIFYAGISQGGIFGPTVLAVDPYITRGHFGVPGNNYAMLMERSENYTPYFQILRSGFPDRIDQAMALPIIQLLWDKIDPISYLPKLSHSPFDPEKPKFGHFAAAKADYQVAVVTNEIAARSDIGIPLLEHYDRERQPWGVQWATYPHEGSGIVLYDFNNPWPPPGNLAPIDEYGDPHSLGRRNEAHNQQLSDFLDTGIIEDVCDGQPCFFPRDPLPQP